MAFTDSIKWNGKSIRDFGAEITDVKGRGKPEVRRKSLSIAGRHGELTFGTKYLPRRIELDGHMEGASHTTLLGDIVNLKSLFSMRESIEALGNEQLSDTDLIGKLEFGDETDRHYRAQYDGIFGLRDISPRWMKNTVIRFGVKFLCTDPFAYDNVLTEVTMAGNADEFKVFDTGTHYSECDIDIHGAVTNPVIVTGDKVGVAHFDNDDDLRNVENVNVAGNFAAAFGFRTRKTLTSQQSKAIQIVNKDNLYYDRGANVNNQNYANLNPYQGTIVLWVKPYFDGDDGKGHMIFLSTDNADNSITVFKRAVNTMRFQITLGGTTVNVSSASLNSSNFGAGSWHLIIGRWDLNNGIDGTSNTLELEINEVVVSNTSALGTPSGLDQFFAIGQEYTTTPDGSNSIFDGLIHWQVYERALMDSEVTDLYNSGAGVEPFVTPDTKLLSAGELSSGDPVSVQYPWVDNEFADGDQEVDPSIEWTFGGSGGTGANTTVTNEATIVKYDLQS
ncbi:MAG: phage tail family protein, partial [Candidatus Marinimicrobia bacterium]|nr:phage tail family protein [Candidatus Neomarinimicrobiota bacterium]